MISEAYNRDCLLAMAEMPDKAFDLAIVDPPYGCGSIERHEGIDWNNAPPEAAYFNELYRVSEHQIIWGSNNYIGHIKHHGAIIWNKLGPDIGRRNMTFRHSHCEIASQSFDGQIKMFSYTWIGNVRGNDYQVQWGSRALHPCEKPVALYKWLLTNYAKPGDRILDTHLGSGSSRIAAYDLGFSFVGYELDKDYFDAQEKRFADHIAQPKLWTPEPVQAEQGKLI
jgi:site-specific DNA-methyltransferase (adenine-specific)